MALHAPDLTQRPPRSPRVRLGGYSILPRMLDKGRATLAGKAGEYHFNCPLDQQFLSYTGIDVEKLREQLARDKSDGDILEWIEANAKNKPSPMEIAAWSNLQENRPPSDVESRQRFQEMHTQVAAQRKDVAAWFDLLDIDDHVTFGGRA